MAIREYTFGLAEDNDIVLKDSYISRYHGKIIEEKGRFYIEDGRVDKLKDVSTNGIFINGEQIKSNVPTLIYAHDTIYIGRLLFDPKLIPTFSALSGKSDHSLSLNFKSNIKGLFTVGSNSDCFISINDNYIKEHNLVIHTIDKKELFVENIAKNAILKYKEKILESCTIKEGESFSIGHHRILNKNGIPKYSGIIGNIKIDCNNLSFYVKTGEGIFNKRNSLCLLDQISLSILPGEFVGIMGPSGAGKTTFLKILSGTTKIIQNNDKKDDESILYFLGENNKLDIYEDYQVVKRIAGYVPQENIVYENLSVYTSLLYSAKLRLKDFSIKKIHERINKIGLALFKKSWTENFKNTQINSISGGQKKRICIAQELLTNPSVIFLDEPTSGLSSVDTENLLKMLKDEVSAGQNTVIMTIHQPSQQAFMTMDTVIIMTRGGKLAYFGPTIEAVNYFSSYSTLPFNPGMNPAEYILQALETRSPEEWQTSYKTSDYFEECVEERLKTPITSNSTFAFNNSSSFMLPFVILNQFLILLSRSIKLKLSDKIFSTLLLLQAPVIALFIVLSFSGSLRDGELLNKNKPEKDVKQLAFYNGFSEISDFRFRRTVENKTAFYIENSKDYFFYDLTQLAKSVNAKIFYLQDKSDEDEDFDDPDLSDEDFVSDDENELPLEKYNFWIDSQIIEQSSRQKRFYFVSKSKMMRDSELETFLNNILKNKRQEKLWKRWKTTNAYNYATKEARKNRNKLLKTIKNAYFTKTLSSSMSPIFYDKDFDQTVLVYKSSEYNNIILKSLYILFFSIISSIWLGTSNSIREFVSERNIFIQERRMNLKLFSYISAHFSVLLFLAFIQAILFTSIIYFYFTVYDPILFFPYSSFLFICFLTISAGVSLGLLISSLVNSTETGISALPILLIPQILFCGVLKGIGAFAGISGKIITLFSSLLVARWSVEALVNLQSIRLDFVSPLYKIVLPFKKIIFMTTQPTYAKNGILLTQGYIPFSYSYDLIILFLFILIPLILSLIVFKLREIL